MKRLTALLLAALLTLSAAAQNRATFIREKLLAHDTTTVLVTAHRGDWRYAPENSLSAIRHSIEIGVDIVEIDLQMTRDGVLILMHDGTLDRTTTGSGKVSSHTWAQISKLYLRNGCGLRTPERVPTLEQALSTAKGKVILNLDKADRYFDDVVKLLDKTGTTAQIIMKGSKSPEEVSRLYGQYLNHIIYMPVLSLNKSTAIQTIADFESTIKPLAYELIYSNDENTTPPQARKKLQGNALIWYNTLWATQCGGHDDNAALTNPDKAWGYLIDTLGANIIQTDRAELLLNYLRTRGLHK